VDDERDEEGLPVDGLWMDYGWTMDGLDSWEFPISRFSVNVRIFSVLGVQVSSETLIGTIHRAVTESCHL
jgi:hypothetical protein